MMRLILLLRDSKTESKSLSRTRSSDNTKTKSSFERHPLISQVKAEQVVQDIPDQGPSNRNIHLGQRR